MDVNAIMQLVSTLGFPIVMCGALFWKMNKQDEQHKIEMSNLTNVIVELKIAITSLKDSINNKGGN